MARSRSPIWSPDDTMSSLKLLRDDAADVPHRGCGECTEMTKAKDFLGVETKLRGPANTQTVARHGNTFTRTMTWSVRTPGPQQGASSRPSRCRGPCR